MGTPQAITDDYDSVSVALDTPDTDRTAEQRAALIQFVGGIRFPDDGDDYVRSRVGGGAKAAPSPRASSSAALLATAHAVEGRVLHSELRPRSFRTACTPNGAASARR